MILDGAAASRKGRLHGGLSISFHQIVAPFCPSVLPFRDMRVEWRK